MIVIHRIKGNRYLAACGSKWAFEIFLYRRTAEAKVKQLASNGCKKCGVKSRLCKRCWK